MRIFKTNVFEEFKNVLIRFPIPLLCSALLTIFILNNNNGEITETLNAYKILIPAFLASGFYTLWAESGKSRSFTIIGSLIAAIIFCGLGAAGNWFDLNIWTLFLGMGLLLFIAPFVFRETDEETVWLFCLRLCFAIVLAIIIGLAFGGGLSAILAAIDALFGVNVRSSIYTKCWTIAFLFVGPVIGLMMAPHNKNLRLTLPEKTSVLARSQNILINYVLAPALIIYALILHIYAAKIGLMMTLPKGQIGWMVLSFTTTLVLFILLSYPWRERCNALTQSLIQNWHYLLLIPIMLLGISVYTRVKAYGFTPERYMLVLFGLWMVWLFLGALRRRGEGAIVSIIGSIAGMLVVTSLGPWGINGFSINDQSQRFVTILERNELLENGLFTTNTAAKITSDEDRKQAHNILRFLRNNDGLDRLKPMFKDHPENPFYSNADKYVVHQSLQNMLGLNNQQFANKRTFAYRATQPSTIAIKKDSVLVSAVSLSKDQSKTLSTGHEISLSSTTLTVTFQSSVHEIEISEIVALMDDKFSGPTFVFRRVTPDGAIVLLIDHLSALKSGEELKSIQSLIFSIIFEQP